MRFTTAHNATVSISSDTSIHRNGVSIITPTIMLPGNMVQVCTLLATIFQIGVVITDLNATLRTADHNHIDFYVFIVFVTIRTQRLVILHLQPTRRISTSTLLTPQGFYHTSGANVSIWTCMTLFCQEGGV